MAGHGFHGIEGLDDVFHGFVFQLVGLIRERILEGAKFFDGLGGAPDVVGDHAVVHERGLVAVVAGQFRGGGGIGGDHHVEALFQQFAHVGFHAEVGGHSGDDHLVDACLAELQDEIV